ncbi:MAG TPA: glycosyltransferase family 39 protein [bacterium]|nr:glycosyltransferase family 39 protein [bacterium]
MIMTDALIPIFIFIILNALIAGAAWRLGCRFSGGRWTDAVLGIGLSYYALVTVVTAVTGFSGVIGWKWLFAASLLVWAASRAIPKNGTGHAPKLLWRPIPVGITVVLLFVAIGGILLWDIATPPPAGGDAFIYHLNFPATWLRQGFISYVDLPYGAQAATYYPLNMELFYLWLMVPVGSDLFVNLGQVPAWMLAGLGVAALARETGIGKPGAFVGGAVAMLAPGLVQQVTVARVDVALTAWFILAVYFAMRWGKTRRGGHLLLTGVALGLLIGTKSIGIMYAVLPGLYLLAQMRGRGARAAGDIAAVIVPAAAFGGFWQIRNWILTGNPFFPLDFNLAGITIFHGAYGSGAMTAFHTSDPMELLRIGNFFLGFWLEEFMLLSFVAAAVISIVVGIRPVRGRLFLFSLPLLVIALFWFVNPHNNVTNGRFLFPAFMLFGYYVAVMVDEAKDITGIVWAWLAPAALIGTSLMQERDHLYRLLRDLAGLAFGGGNELLEPAAGAILVLLAAFLLGTLFAAVRKKPVYRIFSGIVMVICLVVGLRLALVNHVRHKYDWYRAFPVGSAWAKLDRMTTGQSLRIASVGNERAYGLFGSGLRHDVYTVNVDENTDWKFHDYWRRAYKEGRAPSEFERPQWHREYGTYEAWLANLRELNIDIVFATTLEPIAAGQMAHCRFGFPVEQTWASEHPEDFKLMYANDQARIYAVRPEQQ